MYIVNVEGAITFEDKYLIIQRSIKEEHAGGELSLIGGKVKEEGGSIEVLERTLKREIHEEVGVNIKDNMIYLYSTSFEIAPDKKVVNIIFYCEYSSGTPFVKSPNEVENVTWLAAKEILENPNSPIYLKESIKYAECFRNKDLIK